MIKVQPFNLSADTRQIFNYHIGVFKILGLWQSETPSILARLRLLIFSCLSVGLLATLLTTSLFLNSMSEIINNLLMSSIMLLNCIKGLIVYLRKPKLEHLMNKINALDQQNRKQEEISILNGMIDEGRLVTKLINIFYFSSFPCLAIYNILADYDERFWSSTAFYPYDFARKPCVYCTIFVFQAMANFSLLFMAMATDTYPALFCGILGSHVDVLRYKLRSMGATSEVHKKITNIVANTDGMTVEIENFRKDLIASVEYRKDCLRYAYLIIYKHRHLNGVPD